MTIKCLAYNDLIISHIEQKKIISQLVKRAISLTLRECWPRLSYISSDKKTWTLIFMHEGSVIIVSLRQIA